MEIKREIKRLRRKPDFLEGRQARDRSHERPLGGSRTCPQARDRTAPLFSGRLKRRCIGGDTVTETALHVVTPLHWPRGGEHVGDEEADGFRLLIVVGACCAFAACSAITRRLLAHANRESPKSAALAFSGGLSFARPTSPYIPPPRRGSWPVVLKMADALTVTRCQVLAAGGGFTS
jgi:hypothetical protein